MTCIVGIAEGDGVMLGAVAGDFVDAVRACLLAGGYARKENNVESGGTFLVGFRGRLFRVSGDFQVGESTSRYDAVGCGAAYALGSLAETEGHGTTERVNRALRVAERFSAGVRAPFHTERVEPLGDGTPSVPLKKGT